MDNMKNIAVCLVLAAIMGLSSAEYGFDSGRGQVTIRIERGWNLLPAATELVKSESPIKWSDFKYVFVYDVDDNKYVLAEKDGKPAQRDLDLGPWSGGQYGLHASVWAYSEKEGNLVMRWGYPGFNNQNFELSTYMLPKGWNFIYATPHMIGKKIGDIKGDCKIERVYTWGHRSVGDPYEWVKASEDARIDQETVGSTMVIRVSDDCRFSQQIDGPPPLPV
jgi:hypothetical protein